MTSVSSEILLTRIPGAKLTYPKMAEIAGI